MTSTGRVVGAVLCGGASRRMGRDKSLVEVDGVPMVLRVAAALLEGGCDEVVAIGGNVDELARVGLAVVADEHPGEGPLGGVLTALHEYLSVAEAVVVAACDLPRLRGVTVAALLAALEAPFGAAVAMPAGGQLPSLCAAWRPAVAAELDAAFASGERRMRVAIDDVPHVTVHVDPAELVNMNAPDDLRQ